MRDSIWDSMWDAMRDSMRDRKVGLYPAIAVTGITALLFGAGSFWLGRWNRDVAIATLDTEVPVFSIDQTGKSPAIDPTIAMTPEAESVSNNRVMIPNQGGLRISNRSTHPIRIALRSRTTKSQGSKTEAKAMNAPSYDPPAHWDFAPGEGGDRGLLVALPSRAVQLKKGDILVAFAQDGSQRYWGPFVVGETDDPLWNPQTSEWKLLIED